MYVYEYACMCVYKCSFYSFSASSFYCFYLFLSSSKVSVGRGFHERGATVSWNETTNCKYVGPHTLEKGMASTASQQMRRGFGTSSFIRNCC